MVGLDGNGHVHLRTTWSDASGHHSNSEDREVDANVLGIAAPLASNGSHVRFGMHREAGDFVFEGWIASGNGAGTYTFTPDAAFFDDLRNRGFTIDGDDSMGKELSAASIDLHAHMSMIFSAQASNSILTYSSRFVHSELTARMSATWLPRAFRIWSLVSTSRLSPLVSPAAIYGTSRTMSCGT